MSKTPHIPDDAVIEFRDWERCGIAALCQQSTVLAALAATVVRAGHPICLFWGPEARCYFNEAFRQCLKLQSPAGVLGAPAHCSLPDIWSVMGKRINQILSGGTAILLENELIRFTRNGEPQDTYWTCSCNPIIDPVHNTVSGVMLICNDTCAQVKQVHNAVDERQQFVELFEQTTTFMALLSGPEHRVDLANPGYIRLVGNRDIVGKTIAEALPEAINQGFVAMLDDVFSSGKPSTACIALDKSQTPPFGPHTEQYVDFIFQPLRRSRDKVGGIFIQGIDVTTRVVAEKHREALIKLSDELRKLKTTGEISRMAAQILGQTLNVSRAGYGTIDTFAETLHVERDWNAPGVPSLAGELNLRDFGSFIDDLRLGKFIAINDVTKDSRTAMAADALKALNACAFVKAPVMDQDGLVAVLYLNSAVPRDWSSEDLDFIKEIAQRTRTASERLRSELALLESEAKFHTIADAMPQMVWSTLPDGYHDYYNERWYQFTGAIKGTTDGDKWNDMFHPDDRVRARTIWLQSLASGQPYEVQYRLRHHSGEYRWTLGRALPVRDASGKIIRWMGTCTDIHAQKLAEYELNEASHRKDEFLAMLAHELRNPLAPISTAAQLLKLEAADEKLIRQASDIISRQVAHMVELVDDLLDVSRLSRGLVDLDMENVDVKDVLANAVEQVRPLIDLRDHALHMELAAEDLWVRGNKTRLVQVVSNLLNNAAKYTPPGGTIVLAAKSQNGSVIIDVIDNGNGIAASLLPHIFDLFTQGARTPDRVQGGLGLGLSLVKNLVHLHSGEISAQSAGLTMGSTFHISLPRLHCHKADMLRQLPCPKPSAIIKPLNMMIVDDNRDAAVSLAVLLELKGHQVSVYENASSALKAAEQQAPQVFILDIGLPDMDGYELARRLRAGKATANATIIALTGYGKAHDLELSTAAGFDYHLIKPVDAGRLDTVLAQIGPSHE